MLNAEAGDVGASGLPEWDDPRWPVSQEIIRGPRFRGGALEEHWPDDLIRDGQGNAWLPPRKPGESQYGAFPKTDDPAARDHVRYRIRCLRPSCEYSAHATRPTMIDLLAWLHSIRETFAAPIVAEQLAKVGAVVVPGECVTLDTEWYSIVELRAPLRGADGSA